MKEPASMKPVMMKTQSRMMTRDTTVNKAWTLCDEDIPTTVAPPTSNEEPMMNNPNEIRIGPITRARAKLLEQQVNSLLIDYDVLLGEDFILPKSLFIGMIRYHDEDKAQGGEVQVRGEEDEQTDFGRPTRFGRPTSMVKTMLEPLQRLEKMTDVC